MFLTVETITHMVPCSKPWLLWFLLLLVIRIQHSHTLSELKSETFLSRMFALKPGSVINDFDLNINFPRGHIALKSFNGEVVDEDGNPVPLHETYLHHWLVVRYHQRKIRQRDEKDVYTVRNSGICQDNVLVQYFGLGSETRKTSTFIPDPYGIEVGKLDEIPDGYKERWYLNVHAIDTRGVEDMLGCTECRCDLYNVTVDENGIPLEPQYEGGLHCCYHHTQCKVKLGVLLPTRNLYFQYTVKWVEWDPDVIPVKIYIFDVTDTWNSLSDSSGSTSLHNCQIEYDVQPCDANVVEKGKCVHTRTTSITIPNSGYVVYAVAHQHAGGVGAVLYREDESVICHSLPTYGQGEEAGNEYGYIVGMSACYPEPDSVKIARGESLVLKSYYDGETKRTGVMGIFLIMVAEHMP